MVQKNHCGVALVTRAGCDLGQAITHALIIAGCTRIALSDDSVSKIAAVRDAILARHQSSDRDLRIQLYERQLGSLEGLEAVLASVLNTYGQIDYCINCLSLLAIPTTPTADASPELFKTGLASTSREVRMPLLAYQLKDGRSGPNLSRYGFISAHGKSIVNIIPYGNLGIHSGSNVQAAGGYGATGITKALAWDCRADGIRVNAVCPGATDTTEDRGVDSIDGFQLANPLKRLIKVEEVSNAVVFLAGEASSGITGVALPVDSGWSLMHN